MTKLTQSCTAVQRKQTSMQYVFPIPAFAPVTTETKQLLNRVHSHLRVLSIRIPSWPTISVRVSQDGWCYGNSIQTKLGGWDCILISYKLTYDVNRPNVKDRTTD